MVGPFDQGQVHIVTGGVTEQPQCDGQGNILVVGALQEP